MKTILALFVLILLSSRIFGQLQVDAGNDTILCVGLWGYDTIEIGGNPTASGGVEPYVYSWSTNYSVGSLSFPASRFLDDTTKSNPKLVGISSKDINFKLTVIDDIGTQAKDSITIRFSRYVYILTDCYYYINQGDTISLWGTMSGGIGPLSYTWYPNYNISDTTTANPSAWPDITTNYFVYATDSLGCESATSSCWISVSPTGIISIQEDLTNSIVFPNPIENNSIILFDKVIANDLSIQIVNTIGQTVLIDKFSSNQYLIGDKILNRGIYFYMIKSDSNIISLGRFVKE